MTDGKETIDDLKARRDELIEWRVTLAYRVQSATSDEAIAKLAMIHTAIAALDAVIESGAGEPPSPWDDPNYSPIIM